MKLLTPGEYLVNEASDLQTQTRHFTLFEQFCFRTNLVFWGIVTCPAKFGSYSRAMHTDANIPFS